MKKFIILLFVILLSNAVFATDLSQDKEYYKSLIKSQYITYNTTGLVYSIKKKNNDVTEYFMKSGFDPNSTYFGFPVTFYAITVDNMDSLEILLKNGANPDSVSMGGTLLIWAIYNKNTKAVNIIINSGADINKDYMDTIPLNEAIIFNNAEITKMLLNAGATADEKTQRLINKSKNEDIKKLFSDTDI